MKTTTMLALCAMIGATSFAAAQDKPKAPDRPQRQGMRLPPEILKKFDKDGDGKLSPEEAKAAREAHQKEMLEKYDADEDGKLSAEERKKMAEDRRAEMIKRYDKDGDGKLSEEERKALPRFRERPGRPERPEAKPEKKADDTVE
ncbi:MAG: EF-hand domain-containing protein [Akkermansiaceae bacterium]|nr:EF-hand domain-containing protein [Akkermansiaceae bacterium]MCP5548117.1 EF-hand domain-containing protein [Akkermansiaceae bacterium]